MEEKQNIADKLAALRVDYQEKLPGKIKSIEQLWQKLRYFNWNDDAFHTLHNFVHALTGSGKTFGFSALSDSARELEIYLQNILNTGNVPDENQQEKLSQLIVALQRAGENPDKDITPITKVKIPQQVHTVDRNQQLIYLVDDDVHTAEYLGQQLISVGYKVEMFHQIKDVYEALKQSSPAAVIMDIMFPEGSLAGIDTVDNIRAATGQRTPILFMSARTDVTARLRVVRAGGDAYFTKPVDIEALITKLDEFAVPNAGEIHRVLLIEDDVELSQHYEAVLQQAGMITQIVNKPLNTIQVIHEFNPDILLMDMNMPDVNGLELSSVIRHEQHLIGIPIVFITADTNPEIRAGAESLGVDIFLTKPVDNTVLVDVVHSGIIKSRRLVNSIKQVSRDDLHTGMRNRKSFLADLEQAIASPSVEGSCRALIYITIDHFDIIREQIGIINLDPLATELASRIQQSFRSNEQASQMAEAIFAVLAVAPDEASMLQLGESIYKNITQSVITIGQHKLDIQCSIGIAYITDATHNIQRLLTQAEKEAINVSETGGNQIQQYSEQQQSGSVIQTDSEIREKILRAIKEKSFRLVFQPILNIENEHQEFYEVLLRMVDEENKAVLPAQFFPIAADENLLHEIDRWTIEHAITMLSENVRVRTHGTFFVKVSGESISRDSFMAWLCNCISNSRLRGEQKIVFEISEKDVITRVSDVKAFSDSLKSLSCGFALEHFGSTNQNLKLLEELPVDYVKIDGSMISRLSTDTAVRQELETLIKGIQLKNKNIIVGSVDNPTTMAMLWDWGVRLFQGYYIEEPHESLEFDFTRAVEFQVK